MIIPIGLRFNYNRKREQLKSNSFLGLYVTLLLSLLLLFYITIIILLLLFAPGPKIPRGGPVREQFLSQTDCHRI